ncbi:lipid A phosphoethanolamine transferase [Flavobacterium agricola]|uniref:Lipid A phosphoethanolamine transferase n=1 Tax=Flavobacterium agricola TaxID=2870839 RepID=A0ABY6LVY1_9FLAO|nr:lipid A phosphoethanolamine transferase [Flavobacterium agricola]UYW00484.1 lipid A phosphoethanolamine transferase [Flavobacterium agricola]
MNLLKNSSILKNPKFYLWYYVLVNMVPNLYFVFTEPVNFWGQCVIFIFPIALFLFLFTVYKNSGVMQIICIPLLVLHAFQIVLFYLFGTDVIASDMFINVVTTNTSEVNELLGSLLPSIVLVIVLYLPAIILGIRQWRLKIRLEKSYRYKMLKTSLVLFLISFGLSFLGMDKNTDDFSFTHDVYPINALYNLDYAVVKWNKVKHYKQTSKDFTFGSERTKTSDNRQIFVLVVGETGRADNWELYGYERETNPKLKLQENIYLFKDALTQSNTTHKSVSIILSDSEAENYDLIYNKKGLLTAFKEAGFTTICLSSQAENASFIEFFTKEADIYKTIRKTNPKTGLVNNPFDEELLPIMDQMIQETPGDLFILLHTYGSHFNYMDRYPSEFKKFTPDVVTAVSKSNKQQLVNSYDNSILYTDHFLASTIDVLKKYDAETAFLYTSDHGEDLFDDSRGRFLHASPTPTYYQLRIPIFMWFSPQFISGYPDKIIGAENNLLKGISTNAIYHTFIDAANIKTQYYDADLSLLNPNFVEKERMYLNDHDEAVPYKKMNLKKQDFEMLKKNNIK